MRASDDSVEELQCPAPHTLERRNLLKLVLGCAAGMLGEAAVGAAELPLLGVTAPIATQGQERRYAIPSSDGVSIDQSSAVMLTRYQGNVFALSMACPHQRAAVRWLPAQQRFQCSKHDSKYQPTGIYTSGRATRNLDRFPIRRDGDQVIVDVTKVFKADQDVSGWTNAAVAV